MTNQSNIQLILSEGESFKIEYKESMGQHLDREIVAFANAAGGSIFLGVNDNSDIVGIEITNRIKSQIQDIARNCDPSIIITLVSNANLGILEVKVNEGVDKPYRCKDGFFLRIGASAQKLRRDEIVELINQSGKIRFDEAINPKFDFEKDFSKQRLNDYLLLCGIKTSFSIDDILISLSLAEVQQHQQVYNNACVLFFAKDPQRYFPESYITCLRYQTHDRFSIMDKKDMLGSPIEQIEQALNFIVGHMSAQTIIKTEVGARLGQSQKIYDYPLPALREAIINAVTHRDYFYDSSHIYVHMYPSHIDIENPGGLYHGLTIDNLGKRSVRRNRLIADLLHRADYIDRAGTGFDRMWHALDENGNPPMEYSVSNFFNLRFYKRIDVPHELRLTPRQQLLFDFLSERKSISKRAVAQFLNVSDDTALREIKALEEQGLLMRAGTGKATTYNLKQKK